jgi:hypothetical protein
MNVFSNRLFCPLDGLAPRKHVGVFFSALDLFFGSAKAGSWLIVAGNGLHEMLLDPENVYTEQWKSDSIMSLNLIFEFYKL